MMSDIRYWVVIPAAGVGARMGVDKPKQYIDINGKTILEHTLNCFLQREDIEAIVVAVAAEDPYWATLSISNEKKIIKAPGGKERFESVLNGLKALSNTANDDDWVLVHDAARPCLNQIAIDRLINELAVHDVGGILGLPCRDTMKRANASNEIEATVDRENLWHAQTPQMFRFKKLLTALERIVKENTMVTDEAMAMELSGYKPMLIVGHPENIKITHKDDLQNAEMYLQRVI